VYVKGVLPVEDEVDVSEIFKLKLMYSENQALIDKRDMRHGTRLRRSEIVLRDRVLSEYKHLKPYDDSREG